MINTTLSGTQALCPCVNTLYCLKIYILWTYGTIIIIIIKGHTLLRACLQPATNTRNSKPRPPTQTQERNDYTMTNLLLCAIPPKVMRGIPDGDAVSDWLTATSAAMGARVLGPRDVISVGSPVPLTPVPPPVPPGAPGSIESAPVSGPDPARKSDPDPDPDASSALKSPVGVAGRVGRRLTSGRGRGGWSHTEPELKEPWRAGWWGGATRWWCS